MTGETIVSEGASHSDRVVKACAALCMSRHISVHVSIAGREGYGAPGAAVGLSMGLPIQLPSFPGPVTITRMSGWPNELWTGIMVGASRGCFVWGTGVRGCAVEPLFRGRSAGCTGGVRTALGLFGTRQRSFMGSLT